MSTEKGYQVIVSQRARNMLGEHVNFIAQVNKKAATAKRKEIVAAIRSLSEMPQRYPFFEGEFITPNKFHKMVVSKWYVVLYQIRDKIVYVDYILDARKDYPWEIL